jgi:hypothetical protein
MLDLIASLKQINHFSFKKLTYRSINFKIRSNSLKDSAFKATKSCFTFESNSSYPLRFATDTPYKWLLLTIIIIQ